MKIEIRLAGVFRIDRFKEQVLEYSAGTTVREVVAALGLSDRLLGIVVINDHHASVDHVLHDGDSLMLLPLLDGG